MSENSVDIMVENIPAIITAVSAILVFITTQIINRVVLGKRNRLKLYQKQLSGIFEPLQILFDQHRNGVTEEVLEEIEKIVYKNYSILPKSFLKEYNNVLNNETCLSKLGEIISTYFNFTKKMLTYPFDYKAIKREYLDDKERNILNNQKHIAVFIVSIFLIIFIIVFIWLNLIEEIPFFVGIIILAVLVYYVIHWILYGIITFIELNPLRYIRKFCVLFFNKIRLSYTYMKNKFLSFKK